MSGVRVRLIQLSPFSVWRSDIPSDDWYRKSDFGSFEIFGVLVFAGSGRSFVWSLFARIRLFSPVITWEKSCCVLMRTWLFASLLNFESKLLMLNCLIFPLFWARSMFGELMVFCEKLKRCPLSRAFSVGCNLGSRVNLWRRVVCPPLA